MNIYIFLLQAIIVCLESQDYVQIRNSLIILIKILPHFPVLAKLSQCIEKKIEKIKEDEKNKRQDLYILATSYSGQLKARASFIMREADFHSVNEKVRNNCSEDIHVLHFHLNTFLKVRNNHDYPALLYPALRTIQLDDQSKISFLLDQITNYVNIPDMFCFAMQISNMTVSVLHLLYIEDVLLTVRALLVVTV